MIRVGIKGGGEITLTGLSREELEKVECSIRGGYSWIRVVDGKLESVWGYNPLPDPIHDPKMRHFWRRHTEDEERNIRYDLFTHAPLSSYDSPSLTIQHLCGHFYTEESYQLYAEALASFGFECLRSLRAFDGRYIEIWFLCSLQFAKGDLLQDCLSGTSNDVEKLAKALEFLRRRVRFGTLDVSIQRLAMPNPE